MTSEHNEDCKKLLQLMGVPIIVAPSEAEAQCAVMAKAGLVYGAATEDMDCLTFGCPRLIRHLMASQVWQSVLPVLTAPYSQVEPCTAVLVQLELAGSSSQPVRPTCSQCGLLAQLIHCL